MNSLEEQLIHWQEKREIAIGENNEELRAYCSLYIDNIKLQMQVYNLMQPAVKKRMLATPKILVIQNDKTIGEIESELLKKAQAYDKIMSVDGGKVLEGLKSNISILNHLYRVLKVLSENEWKNYLDRQIQAIDIIKKLKSQIEELTKINNDNFRESTKTVKELVELKKKVENFIINHMAYPYNEDGIPYANDKYTKDYVELLQLCKGADRQ